MLLSPVTRIPWIASRLLIVTIVLLITLPSDSSTNASILLSNTSPSNTTLAPLPVITWPSTNTAVPSLVIVVLTPSNMKTVFSVNSPDTNKSVLL